MTGERDILQTMEGMDGFDAQDMFRLQRNVKASPKTHQAVQASQQPVQNTDQPVQKTSNGNADLGELG